MVSQKDKPKKPADLLQQAAKLLKLAETAETGSAMRDYALSQLSSVLTKDDADRYWGSQVSRLREAVANGRTGNLGILTGLVGQFQHYRKGAQIQ